MYIICIYINKYFLFSIIIIKKYNVLNLKWYLLFSINNYYKNIKYINVYYVYKYITFIIYFFKKH